MPLSMTSREIAEVVEKRHDNVKRTIDTLAERGLVHPQIEDEPESDALGRTRSTQVYRVGKRDSYVIVAQLSPEFTARLVDRWQALEAGPISQFAIPQTLAEALRLAADLDERAARAEAQIKHDAPAVAFAEQVQAAPDAISLGQAAKIAGTGRNRLSSLLKREGWLTRYGEPLQSKVSAGYLDVKISPWEHPKHGLKERCTPLVTGKGLPKIVAMVRAEAWA